MFSDEPHGLVTACETHLRQALALFESIKKTHHGEVFDAAVARVTAGLTALKIAQGEIKDRSHFDALKEMQRDRYAIINGAHFHILGAQVGDNAIAATQSRLHDGLHGVMRSGFNKGRPLTITALYRG